VESTCVLKIVIASKNLSEIKRGDGKGENPVRSKKSGGMQEEG